MSKWAPAALLGEEGKGWDVLEKTLDRARAGVSAEMLGAAVQAFETTLDYLKVRVQFGQVIGSFQALQHRAAKMFTDLELARSAVEAALQAIDADSPDVPELVSLAKAKMGDTFHLVSNEMVQMHGGIGMTDAHDAGFYMKRARAAEAAFDVVLSSRPLREDPGLLRPTGRKSLKLEAPPVRTGRAFICGLGVCGRGLAMVVMGGEQGPGYFASATFGPALP